MNNLRLREVDLVAWWTAEGREIDRARRTLRYSA
jgi:hypothetical protein